MTPLLACDHCGELAGVNRPARSLPAGWVENEHGDFCSRKCADEADAKRLEKIRIQRERKIALGLQR